MKTALELLKEFCIDDFVERDCDKAVSLLTKDIHWYGTSNDEDIFNIEEAKAYISAVTEKMPHAYKVYFLEEEYVPSTEEVGTAFVRISIENEDIKVGMRITASSKIEDHGTKICAMHFSVAEEFIPIAEREEKLFNEKRELVLSTISGGMMGGYMKPGFPLYFIDERMLDYLGYESEEEFSDDLGGLVSNIMHPDDRKMVDDEVDRQLRLSDHYTIDYRMKKKDGSYIWVHDIGKITQSEEGEDVIISVCYDITEDHNKQVQLDNMINAMPGGVALYRIKEDGRYDVLYQSKGVSILTGRSEEEFSALMSEGSHDGIYFEDRERVQAAVTKAIHSNTTISIDYRTPNKNGGYTWINASFRKMSEENGCPIMHAVYIQMSQMQELFREITDNAGMAIVVSDIDTKDILYANKYALQIHHREGENYSGEKCYSFLRGYDHVCDHCSQSYDENDSTEVRDVFDAHLNTYFLSQGRRINWAGRKAHIEYMTDNASNKQLQQRLQEMLKNITCGILVSHVDENDQIHNVSVNEGLCRLFERTEEELLENLNPISPYFFSDEDMDKVSKLSEEVTKYDHGQSTFQIYVPDGRVKSVLTDANLVHNKDHTKEAYVTFYDITVQREQAVQLRDVLKNIPGGVCLFHWNGKKLIPLVISEHFSSLLGTDAKLRLNSTNNLDFLNVHPDDIDGLKKAILHALDKREMMEYSYRTWNAKKGQYIWLFCQAIGVPQADGSAYVYASYADITNERLTAQKLRASEMALDIAASEAGLWYWKYEPVNDRAYFGEKVMKDFGLPPQVNDFPESWLKMNVILPEYHDIYMEAIHAINSGEPSAVFEAQVMMHNELHWAEFRFTNLPEVEGQNRIAVCTGRSIDYEKFIATKYELERQKPSLGEKNLLFHAIFNLKTGETEEYGSTVTEFPLKETYPSMETAIQGAADKIIKEDEKKRFTQINSKEYLMSQLKEGNNSFSIDYRRELPDGNICWVKNIIHLVNDPNTKKPLVFEYCYDINDTKMLSDVLSLSAGREYECIASVDFIHDKFIAYKGCKDTDTYQKTIQNYADTAVLAEERERFLENASENKIMKESTKENPYTFTVKVSLEDGSIGVERIRVIPYDIDHQIYVMTRTDVTDILRAEDIQNEKLKDALSIAQQANSYKSNFLSSMSHDMRTPMNAIIGMCELAIEDEKDTAQVHESLQAIYSSSQLLLSLINNILDMNRIESGKLDLNNQEFSMKEELERSKNSFQALADQKKQNLIVTSDIKHDHCKGDVARIHSALDNILSNAVKYTPIGGTVTYHVSDSPTENQNIGRYSFEITDTGYGMDEETMKHMFEPLYRGKTSLTSKIEGTGLGLSITKAIVDLKGGTIACQSEKGKGTKFTVALPLEYIDDEKEIKDTEVHKALSSYDLSKIHVLVCEDHPLNQKVIRKILERAKAEVTIAADGEVGTDMFLNSPADTFDVILMDVRMPNMDGYEATKVIRSSSHLRAKTVPIIAMTANAFAEDVQKSISAGMNEHLAKPIEPAVVYETILKYVKNVAKE